MRFCRAFLSVIAFFLLICAPVFAYQTVVMDFPGNWYKLNYMNSESDAIIQFVRSGYNANNWQESVVFHTFKWSLGRNLNAQRLRDSLLSDVRRRNSSIKINYLKNNEEDTLTSWCVTGNKALSSQCELLRTTQSFEGAMSMHYINKSPQNYYYVRKDWENRIGKAVVYQSYFRLDRVLNKSMTFEL